MSKASKRRDAIYQIIQNQIDEMMPAKSVITCESVIELVKLQEQVCSTFYGAMRCLAFYEEVEEDESEEEEES